MNNGYSEVRWRFLLAFQCFPALLLAAFVKILPDSPRYLASVGRNEEARDLLQRVRRHKTSQENIDHEYLEIIATAQDSKRSSPIQFIRILCGRGGKPGASLGRRAWLCVFLQIMASWTGITVGSRLWMLTIILADDARLLPHIRPSFSARLAIAQSSRMALQED